MTLYCGVYGLVERCQTLRKGLALSAASQLTALSANRATPLRLSAYLHWCIHLSNGEFTQAQPKLSWDAEVVLVEVGRLQKIDSRLQMLRWGDAEACAVN